jgi:hypothetical protein
MEIVDKDELISLMRNRYGDLTREEFNSLRTKWRIEFLENKKEDDGCGHGLIRFLYDSEFTPCHCGLLSPAPNHK